MMSAPTCLGDINDVAIGCGCRAGTPGSQLRSLLLLQQSVLVVPFGVADVGKGFAVGAVLEMMSVSAGYVPAGASSLVSWWFCRVLLCVCGVKFHLLASHTHTAQEKKIEIEIEFQIKFPSKLKFFTKFQFHTNDDNTFHLHNW